MTTARGAGRPRKSDQTLSKQAVIAAALPIVQKEGVDALSFRALAEQLGVTPMAVTYHSGGKKELLADLVEAAFDGTLEDRDGGNIAQQARLILSQYCARALVNAHLLRAVLADLSLMGPALVQITEKLGEFTKELNDGDEGDVLLHLLVDYTHGFVLSATANGENPLTTDDFLRGLDWILDRADKQTEH
ncbi:Transcriptional regulator, TetR family (plasmid) [Roseivivax sp. THAF40]|uniref:TetR/AcrR family transcriptional regulator n=1 Tax=Roseivivax sp. THAF40 TaxID=2587858 RepID=UPI001268B4D4|nr:TetR family transcriptional regulator [Roseivivax sp. THAF40]QFT48993.1 Transcriptional regulator, TetR family [Roseivivax sp. THAF40]